MRQYSWILFAIIAIVICSAFRITLALENQSVQSKYDKVRSRPSRTDMYAAGDFHKRLVAKLALPPIDKPQFESSSESISGDETVIGILVDGQPVAFPVAEMSSPDNHLVAFNFGAKNLTVTHCNLSGCSRVFESDQTAFDTASPVQMGGLQEDGRMVLLVDEVRYSHDSKAIPLQDYDFQVMPFSHWDCEYPDTLLYTGEKPIAMPLAP